MATSLISLIAGMNNLEFKQIVLLTQCGIESVKSMRYFHLNIAA